MTPDRIDRRPEVRFASLREAAARRHDLLAALTAEERERAGRFVRREDGDRFALGRHLLRDMIADRIDRRARDVHFMIDTHGRPQVPDRPGLGFNLSHSGDIVAAAIGWRLAVGIDVERHRPEVDLMGVGRIVFTGSEMAGVAAAIRDGTGTWTFFRQWTLKEAVIKALGTGFSLDARRFEVVDDATGLRVRFVGDGADDIGAGWTVEALQAPEGYSAAIAYRPVT